jgi:hypothetical protein
MRRPTDRRWLVVLVAAMLAGCDAPVVEHLPGPASFLIRVMPPDALDRVAFAGYGDRVVLFAASRGEDRYLHGTDLPSTLRARVDGRDCIGSIEMTSGVEYDGTLAIDPTGCSLRLDEAHPLGAVDHGLSDDGPVAS